MLVLGPLLTFQDVLGEGVNKKSISLGIMYTTKNKSRDLLPKLQSKTVRKIN